MLSLLFWLRLHCVGHSLPPPNVGEIAGHTTPSKQMSDIILNI